MPEYRASRSASSSAERLLIRKLRAYGISGWRRKSNLLGKPDFVFNKAKLAIFVDGDFWHGNPTVFRTPRTNSGYWRDRVAQTRKRDAEVSSTLKRDGWKVIRVWESDIERDCEALVGRIRLFI